MLQMWEVEKYQQAQDYGIAGVELGSSLTIGKEYACWQRRVLCAKILQWNGMPISNSQC
jgi:hypothetical protein